MLLHSYMKRWLSLSLSQADVAFPCAHLVTLIPHSCRVPFPVL